MANTGISTAAMKGAGGPLPLVSVNHMSLVCRSVEDSTDFYEKVLGFFPVKRPGSLNLNGAWLFGYRMGIHLLQSPNPDSLPTKTEINPMDNHISFQCKNMQVAESKLVEMNIKFIKRTLEEGGICVDQLFFHDPDGFMIEICNCENFPIETLPPPCTAAMKGAGGPLPLVSVNHMSLVCRSVEDSKGFYEKVLGFIPIKRPPSINVKGAWLFAYGMGIHLLQSPNPDSLPTKTEINPMDNHISFQCKNMQVVESELVKNMQVVESMLVEMNIKFIKPTVEEGGIWGICVDQLFFHDPDGFMIEICNCEKVPLAFTPSAPCTLNSCQS